MAVAVERERSGELAEQSERKLIAMRDRAAREEQAEQLALATAEAAAEAAYDAQWVDPNELQAGAAQPATSWIGLAISLESLGRKSEAVLAYRRALAAGPLAQEARDYAESRARALE